MESDWAARLAEQLGWHWDQHVRPRLDGLTDEEFYWEPVDGCWSLRPRAQAHSTGAVGGGDLVLDFAYPEPVPVPFTTIAWRLCHLISGVFGMRNASHFGGPPMSYDVIAWPASASAALALLDDVYAGWMAGVTGLSDDDLARAVGPAEGPFAERPYAELVLHINREAIHHAAEVLCLRDLFRSQVH
jgi:hypothetical protein